MFCQRCGTQIPEDSTICPRCGTPAFVGGIPHNPTTPGEYIAPPVPGEQFVPPPLWQSPGPVPGGAYPGRPTSFGPPPPSPPLTTLLFGPRPQPGVPLIHHNRAQRWLLSRMHPSAASSVWIGAVGGALIAFALVLLLSVAFSLTLGPTLDQSSIGAISTGEIGTSLNSTSTRSFYSNPLIVLAYAHRTTINVNSSIAVSGTTQAESASVTLPVTLLLLIPAIGLMVGGYLAASTNYSGRRLFSITRGASIGILYALLILLISLVTSTTFSISLGGATSESLSYSPDAISALLSGLLCGVVFGALGGALQSRSISPATPARPVYRGSARIRAALIGAVGALGTYFVLCLVLVVALYAVAQLGGPAPHTEGSLSLTGSTNNPCHVFLQQPAPSAQPAIKNDFPTHLSFAIISPTLALWVMTVSMGAPLQLSILGFAFNFGFFNADCQPGPEGILLYLFLLLPAVSVFGGGWMAARSAQPRSTREAAGIGLLLAPAIAILFLILSLLASISESVSLGGLGTGSTTISFGPAISSTLLASLLFGGIFGILGSIAGRPRHLPPLQPAVAPAWPATPGAWPPAAQPPAQPIISSAVASFRPAPFEPAPGSPGGQPSGEPTSPEPPDAMLPSEVPSET